MKTLSGAQITIGAGTFINDGVRVYASRRVQIGPDCLIGDHCWIFDTNFHQVHEDSEPAERPILIGRNVWLGRCVQVLPGVEIGDHSVVSAGSVVSHSLPARSIARGNPAEVIGQVRCSDDFKRH